MNTTLRFALRSMWRSKAFTLTVLVTLSLGIGATVTVFSVVDALLLRPATFPDPKSVVALQASEKNKDWDNLTLPVYDRLRLRADLFSQVAASRAALFTVTSVPVPDQLFGLSVSGDFFSMLEARPWRGRLVLQADDKPGAPAAALLSYEAWRRVFFGDPNVIGKTAKIDGTPYFIIGTMPADFVPPGEYGAAALWTALRLTDAELASPEARQVRVWARLRPSVTLARAQGALNALALTSPANAVDGRKMRLRASQWRDQVDVDHQLTFWLALGMVSGLLLIGCANTSSILLARGVGRRREYAIRLAVGASRRDLITQSLLEVGLLAFAALGVACLGTSIALHLMRDHLSIVQFGAPNVARIQLTRDSLLFSLGVASLSAIICGLAPALSTASVNPAPSLRGPSTEGSSTRSIKRFLHSLIAVESGISILLVLTSGLLVRSLARLISADHGFRPDRVLTLRMPTGSWQQFSQDQPPRDRQRQTERYLDLMRQAKAVPGVEGAALTSSLPLSHTVVRTRLYAPNRATSLHTREIMPISQSVTNDYFQVMGIPLLSGRTFETRERNSKLQVAVVNEAFVRDYFKEKEGDAVGRLLRTPGGNESIQIVGVVKDSPHLDLAETIEPQIYWDFEQNLQTPFLTGLVMRTRNDPQLLTSTMRKALPFKSSEQPIVHVQTLRTLMDQNAWQPRFSAWLFSAFSLIALFLSAIGIYGVVVYITRSRRRDFGIRSSLGAEPNRLFRLVVLESLRPVLVGIFFGVMGSYGTGRWIASLLYKTRPLDLGVVLASVAIVGFVAIAGTAGPALRAALVDPAIILRSE